MVSGSERSIGGIIADVGPTHRIIVSVVTKLCGASVQGLRKDRASAKELLTRHGLRPVSFLDAENGGATDACHVIGFGGDLCLDILPRSSKGLPLTLCHFLDGGAKGLFPESSRVPLLGRFGRCRPPTVSAEALGRGAGQMFIPVFHPAVDGVLPLPFLSATVDSTLTDSAGVAPVVSVATVDGFAIERS